MQMLIMRRVKREVRDSILGICSFASFSVCYLISIIFDFFSITYLHFTPHIILQINVRISLVHPRDGITRAQVKQ
jgi:hypothetical protein